MNKEHAKAVAVIIFEARQVAFVGSRVTCEPAPTDTDRDILVLVDELGGEASSRLQAAGWHIGGSGDDDDDFESWTLGQDNIILTDKKDFYDKFVLATKICGHMNIMCKKQRTQLFQGILYGNVYCHAFAKANDADFDPNMVPF